jgi:hypothetical protein
MSIEEDPPEEEEEETDWAAVTRRNPFRHPRF